MDGFQWMVRRMNSWLVRWMDCCIMYEWMDGCMNGGIYGWMDGRMYGCMDA